MPSTTPGLRLPVPLAATHFPSRCGYEAEFHTKTMKVYLRAISIDDNRAL